MADNNYIYKTKPNYLFILLMIIGVVFCAFIVNLVLSSNMVVHGVSEKTGHLIIIIFICFFALLGLGCLFIVVGFKMFYLTHDELIMSRPFLFYKRSISLLDIGTTSEADASISISRGLSYKKMNIGHKTTVLLKSGKKIVISSVEIWGYNMLMKKLDMQIRINKDRHHQYK